VTLSQKELLELKYWIRAELLDGPDGLAAQKAMQLQYVRSLGLSDSLESPDAAVLEIGAGPCWGMLPSFRWTGLCVAVDPLFEAFGHLGLLENEERGDIRYYSAPFEQWDTDLTFDAILCANALDHGEMGFHLLPKIARLLKPGGRFYLYVHLRPPALLNLLHDHSLTLESLDKHLSYTHLVEVSREILGRDDIADWNCPTLIGIWQKPL
jgi:SAM-dependent methyltransferase